MLDRLTTWCTGHFYACKDGYRELFRAPLTSLMTIAVIGIAIALPAGLYLLLQNVQTISKPWSGAPSVSLYLKQNTSNRFASTIIEQLKARPHIKNVH